MIKTRSVIKKIKGKSLSIVGIMLFTAVMSIFVGNTVNGAISTNLPTSQTRYDQNDNSSVFPASYRASIQALKSAHPNWTFKAVYTNLDWNLVLRHETYEVTRGISTVPDYYPDSWKRDGTNTGNYVDGNFVVASKEAVAYSMDPRNFINKEGIFQFETLKYAEANSNLNTIDKILSPTLMGSSEYKSKYKKSGSWIQMGKTYAEIIRDAGFNSKVSPIYIASRIRQETGGNIANNLSINGSYPGYEGLYNFYNIGASPNPDGSGAIQNGLARARSEKWFHPETSINGGINIIKKSYIDYGQDTVYFQKFDVNNPYGNASILLGHQYMTNILAPSSESKISYNAYKGLNILNDSFEFCIPVYNNMPSSNASYPGNNTLVNIETDLNGKSYRNKIPVEGWLMSTDKNAKVKILVDGKDSNVTVSRIEREDVLKAVNGYGGRENNPTPGFKAELDANNMTDDNHIITIEILSASGTVIKSESFGITVDKYKTRLELEKPTIRENVNRYMDVQGWIMSDAKDAKVEIRINGNVQNVQIDRISREDVLQSVNGYGGRENNPTPGFKTKIDTALLGYGANTIEVFAYSNTGHILKTVKNEFEIKTHDAKMYLESPQNNDRIREKLKVFGWIMCEDPSIKINTYLDNNLIENTTSRISREDVLQSVSGYGGRESNPNPGFEATIDTSKINDGVYELKVELVDSYGRTIMTDRKQINILKYTARLNLEYPEATAAYADKLHLRGWAMSEDANIKTKTYLDGKEQNTQINRVQREDVLQSVKGYGDRNENPSPGFETYIDTTNISKGLHNVRIDLVSLKTNEILSAISRDIEITTPKIRHYIENTSFTHDGELSMNGWVMSNDKDVTIQVLLDGELKKQSISRISREDVLESVKGYGERLENPEPGFKINIQNLDVQYGIHNVTLKVLSSKNELIAIEEKNIEFSAPNTRMHLEYPNTVQVNGENLYLRGWLMSEDRNSKIEVKLNNIKINKNISRTSREDVLESVKGYGDRKSNPTPGFELNIDTSNIPDGIYPLEVKIVSGTGKDIIVDSRNIEIKKYISKMNIETNNVAYINSKWEIGGWLMCTTPNYKIEMYIDNNKVSQQPERISREDVLQAVKGYGDRDINQKPGFIYKIDSSLITKQQHTIKIVILSEKNEVIETVSQVINFKK